MYFRRSDHLRTVAVALLVAAALLTAGCGRRDVLGKVSGNVTLAGETVKQGYVIFRNDAQGVHMMAEIDDTGHYEVAMADGYGLPLGEYRVYLSPPMADVPFGPSIAPPPKAMEVVTFPDKYLQPGTSGLSLTVEKGENRLDVEMEP